jgi:DNA transformation protein and related proteins
MPVSPEYKEFVKELLTPLGAITIKPFFGGLEVKYGEVQFAWVLNDVLYFKVDDINRCDFEEAGVPPFEYERNGRVIEIRKLHEVPAFLFDEPDEMLVWARKAVEAEMRAQKAKSKKKRPKRKARS